MLTATDLYCERDDRVLFDNLDITLPPGRVMRVQGANGSGKTTLLRILCGLYGDYRGEVCWRGTPIAKASLDYLRNMFYLGHASAIKKILTPLENLRWFCSGHGGGDDGDIRAALAQFGLKGYDDVPCFMLSAGQQRRVSLARLALTAARLWILDEPFTALDRKGVGELERFLAAHAESGGSVILTTHHPLEMPGETLLVDLDRRAWDRGVEA